MKTKPFAITLDPGSSLANHTGSWRTVRPVYVDRLPPCNHACPAGENIQGWLFHAESGDYEQAWRAAHATTTRCPRCMGRVCYHPCETPATAGSSTSASASTRSSASSATRRCGRAGSSKPPASRDRQARAGGRAPARPDCPPPISSRALGHAVTIREAGPLAGGMMRFGIPEVPAAARRARRGDRSASSTLGVTLEAAIPR